MSFAERCSLEFAAGIRSRGQQYYYEGRVELAAADGDTVGAIVVGNSRAHEVSLDWSEAGAGIVGSFCTCPYYAEWGACEHVWAAMLAADARGIGAGNGKGQLRVVEVDGDEFAEWGGDAEWGDNADDWEDESPAFPHRRNASRGGRPPSRQWRAPHGGRRRQPRVAGWQEQLASVFDTDALAGDSPAAAALPFEKAREAWYVLDVATCVITGTLAVQLFHRETKLNGEFGKLKALSIDRHGVDSFPRPEDRELLRLLLAYDSGCGDQFPADYGGYSHYGYQPKVSEMSLRGTAYEQVLPKLCATGRLVWTLNSFGQKLETEGRPLAWDDGPPWRFRLRIEPDDKNRRWLLEGELVREAATLPLKTPPLMVADGLVLHDDRLARLEAGGSAPWIVPLRRFSPIAVPYRDRWKLLQRLWRLPSPPDGELPANLRCEEVRVPPQGRLTVHAPDRFRRKPLDADVEFQYDDQKLPLAEQAAGVVDAKRERVVVRDRQREQELLAFLAAQGARAAERKYGPPHDVSILQQRLPELVGALVQAGWSVEAEGHQFRKPGQWRLSVTSGVDWFDLEGTCAFDGMTAGLPDLLAALRRGEKYVRLSDGSRGLLPEEWLKQFAPFANLGETEGDRVRFRPSQALLLDAMLAAQKDVAVDRQFAHVRGKLRSFAGVAPHDEPRGFQRPVARVPEGRARLAALPPRFPPRRLPGRRHGPGQDRAGAGPAAIAPRTARR